MLNVRDRVVALMEAWGYAPESIGGITPVLDVFRVETTDGPKNLKWTRHSDAMLVFVTSALRHQVQNGFTHLREPLPTRDGRPFLVHQGQHYLLSDWIEGQQADLTRPEELAVSCRTLALFHQASRGYRAPAGADLRRRWGLLHRSLAKRCLELAQLPRQAASRPTLTGFDREIWAETEYYLTLANFARKLLAVSDYGALAAKAARQGSLCHGDVAARNFIVTPAGDVSLIDFDGLSQDLPLVDLWKLYRRAMKAFSWDAELGLKILEAYETVYTLSPAELEVLMALVSFPQKFWRLANRYYSGHYPGQEERFCRKLRKYTAQRKGHAGFLRRLAELCRSRGVTGDWPAAPFLNRMGGSR